LIKILFSPSLPPPPLFPLLLEEVATIRKEEELQKAEYLEKKRKEGH